MSEVLAPFSDNQQRLLKIIDATCAAQAKVLREEMARCALANEPPPSDPETVAWQNIIIAYGLLFNRCVEAGWIDDTYVIGDHNEEGIR